MALGQVGSMAVALLGDINDFTKKMDQAEGKVSSFDKSVAKMGKAVTKAAKAAAIAAAAAVTAFAVSAVKDFVAFDTGMREVFTLMPELSLEAKDAMMEDVLELSEAIAVVPEEVIPALYQAISAGVPRENVFTFMEVAGRAAIGGVTELAVAVDGLTTVTNAYGSEVISVEEVANIMFTTVKEGKTTFDELSARLFQAVPVAAAIGLEFQNVAAAAAQVTLSGVPMRVAMTQIRSLLNEVAFEGKELNKVFQDASGMTFPQFIESGGDIADIIEILEGAAADAGISIAELTSNLEAQGALLNLSGVSLSNLREILDEMANSAGAADAAYEEMAAGVQYELDQLAVWWKTLKLDVGGDLTENLQDLLGWLQDNREAIGDGIKAVFDGLIDGLQWMTDNADTVKAGLIVIAAGFTALFIQANPVAVAITAVVAALMWFNSTGGVANTYDAIQDVAQSFRDVAVGGTAAAESTGELGRVLAGYFESLGNRLSDQMMIVGESRNQYIEVIDSIRNAQQKALDELEEGADFDVVVNNFKVMAKSILAEAGVVDSEVLAIVDLYTDSAIGFFKSITVSAEESSSDISDSMDVVAGSTVLTAQMMTGAWGIIEEAAGNAADNVETAVDDIDEAVVGLGVGMTQVMRDVIADEMDRLADKAEQNAQEIRDIISSSLADTLWELGTFHRKAQDAEKDHQQRMQDIIEGAADRLADITKSDQRRREDAQLDHDRALEDIEEWYQEQVIIGAESTYEKKIALDAAKQEKIEDAEKTHKQKLEDLDIALTRATEDNTEDRIQASDDELAAYEENIPKMGEVIKTGFESMATSILQSGIDKAADKVVEWLWNIAFEAEAAKVATNTSLAGIGTGAGAGASAGIGSAILPITAVVGTLGIASDIISGKSTFVNWVEDALGLEKFFGDLGLGSGANNSGAIRVPAYGGGGIVPGPMGAPQMAIVHGGEPIGAAGFEEVLDYERLGNAVAAGVFDAMSELGSDRPINVYLPDGTKLAQKLYDPLQREADRRGGS